MDPILTQMRSSDPQPPSGEVSPRVHGSHTPETPFDDDSNEPGPIAWLGGERAPAQPRGRRQKGRGRPPLLPTFTMNSIVNGRRAGLSPRPPRSRPRRAQLRLIRLRSVHRSLGAARSPDERRCAHPFGTNSHGVGLGTFRQTQKSPCALDCPKTYLRLPFAFRCSRACYHLSGHLRGCKEPRISPILCVQWSCCHRSGGLQPRKVLQGGKRPPSACRAPW